MRSFLHKFRYRYQYKIKKIIGIILGTVGLFIVINMISIEGLLVIIGIVLIALGLMILKIK